MCKGREIKKNLFYFFFFFTRVLDKQQFLKVFQFSRSTFRIGCQIVAVIRPQCSVVIVVDWYQCSHQALVMFAMQGLDKEKKSLCLLFSLSAVLH